MSAVRAEARLVWRRIMTDKKTKTCPRCGTELLDDPITQILSQFRRYTNSARGKQGLATAELAIKRYQVTIDKYSSWIAAIEELRSESGDGS